MSNDSRMKMRDEAWEACPPGALRRMVAQVRENRRRTAMHRATSALAIVLLLGVSLWLGAQLLALSRSRNSDTPLPDMACAEVQRLLSQYGHGALAAALEERIAAHLQRCEHCRVQQRKLRKDSKHQHSEARGDPFAPRVAIAVP